MGKSKHINDQIKKFQELDNVQVSVDQKLEELINLLENSELDSESIKNIHNKFNKAVERKSIFIQEIEEFRKLDDSSMSRFELADDLEKLLSKYKLDSNDSKKVIINDKGANISLIAIALVLIVLGFAMIIMPAPPYFEMFTIFYFSQNDGVTLMDLIALLIVFTGVYLFIQSMANLKRSK
ncbi:hypothetical protein ADIARSV_0707 [Arcticibacter svalbardensis MN12-7]|uniref:Uncharacterized protein n=1 Tax=Arcticibacter svalbardensis MN12-7 TaxID=1150600 RepID=R9GWM2_9SPHI|nr:hypothetical protein [Arcticibacter svalbardensis]EOR96063.1 hypothetical protein ADIARSV_0707 [Arcticibacter svalbardensis MN12-7]